MITIPIPIKEEPPMVKPKQDKKDDIQVQHEKLQKAHTKAQEDYKWWSTVLSDPRMRNFLKSISTDDPDILKEKIRAAKGSAGLATMQADVCIREKIINDLMIMGSTGSVDAAKKALAEFEKNNGLFTQSPEEGQQKRRGSSKTQGQQTAASA